MTTGAIKGGAGVKEVLAEKKELVTVVNLNQVPADYRNDVKAVYDNLDLTSRDLMAPVNFCSAGQKKMSEFADKAIDSVRADEAGRIGEMISKLLVVCESIDIEEMRIALESTEKKEKGIVGKIADFFSKAKVDVKSVLAKYDKVGGQVDAIAAQLMSRNSILEKDIISSDEYFEHTMNSCREIECGILALQFRLEELRIEVENAKKKAQDSGDYNDIQSVRDLEAAYNRWNKKLDGLHSSRMLGRISLLQTRMIQDGDLGLIQKNQDIIINMLPGWKGQLLTVLKLINQAEAAELSKRVTDMNEKIWLGNSRLLGMNMVAIATEVERDLVSIETLGEINNNLIKSLRDVKAITEAGSKKRADAVEIRRAMEDEQREALLS